MTEGVKAIPRKSREIVPAIRRRFGRRVRIIVRADSGFAREDILSCCEQHGLYYCIGFARNPKVASMLAETFDQLHERIDEDELKIAKCKARATMGALKKADSEHAGRCTKVR